MQEVETAEETGGEDYTEDPGMDDVDEGFENLYEDYDDGSGDGSEGCIGDGSEGCIGDGSEGCIGGGAEEGAAGHAVSHAHCAVYHLPLPKKQKRGDLFICHGDSIKSEGMPKLVIRTVRWNHGWPELM